MHTDLVGVGWWDIPEFTLYRKVKVRKKMVNLMTGMSEK